MKANITPAVVETVTRVVEPEKVTLEMTKDEAKILGAMIGTMNTLDIQKFVKIHDSQRFEVWASDVDTGFGARIYVALSNVVGKEK